MHICTITCESGVWLSDGNIETLHTFRIQQFKLETHCSEELFCPSTNNVLEFTGSIEQLVTGNKI